MNRLRKKKMAETKTEREAMAKQAAVLDEMRKDHVWEEKKLRVKEEWRRTQEQQLQRRKEQSSTLEEAKAWALTAASFSGRKRVAKPKNPPPAHHNQTFHHAIEAQATAAAAPAHAKNQVKTPAPPTG
jgi:hypothetical protein